MGEAASQQTAASAVSASPAAPANTGAAGGDAPWRMMEAAGRDEQTCRAFTFTYLESMGPGTSIDAALGLFLSHSDASLPG